MKDIFTLSIVMLFVFFKANAQITVKDDNYIYVEDKVVFSENYLNLENTNSRFYLRSEAQLIQGSVDIANLGTGELSVYQNGNVGAHEYNYWCSPIGSITNNTSNNPFGISLLNDIINSTNSTPVTFIHNSNYNGTASPLNIEPYWIWKFIATDEYSDWIHVEENTTINPGEGFTMKGTSGTSTNNPGDNQNYDQIMEQLVYPFCLINLVWLATHILQRLMQLPIFMI